MQGNNPLAIFCYDGFILYASTKELLKQAECRLKLHHTGEILTEEGDILRMDRYGEVTHGSFIPQHSYRHLWRMDSHWSDPGSLNTPEISPCDDLLDVARSMGFSEAEITALLDFGCSAEEIEEMLYDPAVLHEVANELLYAY